MSKQKKILPIKTDKDTIIEYSEALPSRPFFISCIAPPRSGKTSTLLNILLNDNLYSDNKGQLIWKNIYYISPSYLNDATLQPLRKLADDPKNDKITITGIYEDIEDLDIILREIINHLNSDEVKQDHKENNINSIIVIDDSATMMNKQSNKKSVLAKLASTFRHVGAFGVDIIAVSQRYRTLPATLRACSSAFLIYKINSKDDLKFLIDDLGGTFGDDNFKQAYEHATTAKYNFLTVDMRKGLLCHNFENVIYEK